MKGDLRKQEFLLSFEKHSRALEIDPIAWAVLDNHYHCILECKKDNLPAFIGKLHGGTSFSFNKEDKSQGRKVWHQYWDRLIRGDEFYQLVNYVHYNPLKHGLVSDYEQLKDYPFSSYPAWLKMLGEEKMNDLLTDYPYEKIIIPD